jgi:hypothetical protein
MPASANVKLESKVDLKQDKVAGKKTFAGEEAVRYSLTGSATVKRNVGGGFPGGGFPGRRRFPGGFPGGGFPAGGRFPGGGYPGGGRGSGGGSRPGGAPGSYGRRMPSKLAKTKGFPVASRVVVTMTSPQSPAPTTITTTTEVKSITDATLDESLFKVPDGYKEVAPRPVPVRPGAGDTGRSMATPGPG